MRAAPRWRLAVVRTAAARTEAGARRLAADALAEAGRRLRDEEAAREALNAHRRAAREAAGSASGREPLAAALAVRGRFVARCAEDDARLAAAVALRVAEHVAAREEAERRRLALGEAAAAVRALDGRRQAWGAARARDRAAAEEDANDELVSARWRGAS